MMHKVCKGIEFLKMQNLKLPLLVILPIIILANIQFIQDGDAAVATQTYTIDLTGQPNTVTFPYGVCTDSSQYAYFLIYASGQVARFDVNALTQTIYDNDAGTSGFDWYSCVYKNGKIFITERDTGRMKINTAGTNTFDTIALPPDISGGVVSYTEGYNTSPHKITINGGGCNNNQQEFGFDSNGEVQDAEGFIWVLHKYNYDFSATNEDCGATDTSFVGIIKINPSTNAVVSRTAISGASDPRGITSETDLVNGTKTIFYITDYSANKLFKFDPVTLTLNQTINLPAGSKARGIDCTATNCYIALNKAGGSGENSKILQVVRADGTTSEIDTGATNTSTGTFEVSITSTDVLMWSDQSGHTGSINLADIAEKTVTNTSSVNSNHFGVEINGQYWWAGEGSPKFSVTNIPSFGSTDSNGSDELREFLKSPTYGVSHDDRKIQLVDYGFTWCGTPYKITDNRYTPFDKIEVKIGTSCNAVLKIFSYYNLDMVELALVSEVGKRDQAEPAIDVYFDHYMNVSNIIVRQDDKIFDEIFIDASYKKVECTKDETSKVILREGELLCHEIIIKNIIPREKPFFEKIVLVAIDSNRRSIETYLNEGFDITGKSLNPLKTDLMASSKKGIGLEEMVLIDKFTGTWSNVNGDLYTRNNYGSWILISTKEIENQCNDWSMKVLERNNCNFEQMKAIEKYKAVLYLQTNYPELFVPNFDKINNIVASPTSEMDSRTKLLQENNMMWIKGIQ